MILSLSKISEIPFCAQNLYALQYSPIIKSYRHERGRDLNGFLYGVRGGCTFTFGAQSVRMEEGALIYLPRSSRHAYTVDEGDALYMRVDFSLSRAEDGEEILFADVPTLLFEKTPQAVLHRMEELLFLFEGAHGGATLLRRQASLLSLLAEIQANLAPTREALLLRPAMDALTLRYRESLSGESLAALCSLSATHFRRLFRALYGITPTEYRNRLRIEHAKPLLLSGNLTVGEIADRLGFESIFYFSRVFKAQTGMSPLAFARK